MKTDPSSVELEAAIRKLRQVSPETLLPEVSFKALEGLKFTACLPEELARRVLQVRMTDVPAVGKVLAEPVRFVNLGEGSSSSFR
jgi:ATP-dependent Lhr-like helicase